MWLELIQEYVPWARVYPAATLEQIADVEGNLGVQIPSSLRTLLQETNGIGLDVSVCPTDEITRLNVDLRSVPLEEAGFEVTTLLFFGHHPNGDYLAVPVSAGQAQDEPILLMSHDDWNRQEVGDSLEEYFTHVFKVLQRLRQEDEQE